MFEKDSNVLYCFIFLFRGAWHFVWGDKPLRGDGTATGVLRNFYSYETVPPCNRVWELLG